MKEEILQKSLDQFLKYGIRDMTNQKLVELLGISTKTIYKYFKNKEELLEEALYLFHAQVQEKLRNLPAGKDAVCLFYDFWHKAVMDHYDVSNVFYTDINEYYPEFARKIEAAVTGKYSQEFIRILHNGIEEGSFRKDIIPEVVLENIFSHFEVIVRSDRFKRFHLSPDIILYNTIATTIRGICTAKGVEELDDHLKTNYSLVKGKKSTKKLPVHL
jgi:AcrR family transcriptional regulator